MVGFIRFIALVVIGVAYAVTHSRRKKTHKQAHQADHELKNYKKNEEGLYPWEEDIDDSPTRIPDDAKRYINKARLKRGRW